MAEESGSTVGPGSSNPKYEHWLKLTKARKDLYRILGEDAVPEDARPASALPAVLDAGGEQRSLTRCSG